MVGTAYAKALRLEITRLRYLLLAQYLPVSLFFTDNTTLKRSKFPSAMMKECLLFLLCHFLSSPLVLDIGFLQCLAPSSVWGPFTLTGGHYELLHLPWLERPAMFQGARSENTPERRKWANYGAAGMTGHGLHGTHGDHLVQRCGNPFPAAWTCAQLPPACCCSPVASEQLGK